MQNTPGFGCLPHQPPMIRLVWITPERHVVVSLAYITEPAQTCHYEITCPTAHESGNMHWALPNSEAVNASLCMCPPRIQQRLISSPTVGGGESCRTVSSMPAMVARSTGLIRTCCRATPSSPWPTGTLHAPSHTWSTPMWRATDAVNKKWL